MKKIVLTIALMLMHFSTLSAENASPPANAALCAACHGAQGISTNPQWPNIAGQHRNYLLKQLQDYKHGASRNDAAMSAVVNSLSEQDMADLAVFYSLQPIAEGATPERYVKRGEQLYRGGDFAKQITACIACHGPKGTGNGQAGFPSLSGQHAAYIIEQLQAFKEHKRTNDLNGIMQDISAKLSSEDMAAVAYYIQGLH
ncbi:c-type cytochrome [Legionella dresdenensis]|uniref:C-type cytochrome n=1 Tax=Legionella dresdenensis TaxID=450200 RepID=A0ABV8CD74_9GAMM